MQKTLLKVVVPLVIASVVLISCASPVAETPAPATEAPAVVESSPEATEDVSSSEPVELVYWSVWNQEEPQAQAIQATIDEFEAANPNITITVTWNGRQNQTLLRNALAAGTKVDLMDQDADQVAGGMVAAGLGYPLNDFLKENALDEEVSLEEVFVPGTLHMFDVDGNTYLIPYIYNTYQFFYNKAIFSEAGIETAPATWDELIEDCGKISEAGYAPIAVESDIQLYNAVYFTYLLERIKGAGWMTTAALDTTGELWKDPAVLQAAEMSKELWTAGCIPDGSQGYKWPQGQQTVASNETAMELVGSWLPTELSQAVDPDFQWGAFSFPEVEGGIGKSSDMQAYIMSYMILNDSAHPKEAFDFIKFMLTKESAQKMVEVGMVGTTRKGVDWPENLREAQTAAENATVLFAEGDGLQSSNAEYWVKVVRDPYNEFFMGDMSAEDFVAKLASDSAAFWAAK